MFVKGDVSLKEDLRYEIYPLAREERMMNEQKRVLFENRAALVWLHTHTHTHLHQVLRQRKCK